MGTLKTMQTTNLINAADNGPTGMCFGRIVKTGWYNILDVQHPLKMSNGSRQHKQGSRQKGPSAKGSWGKLE